MPTFPPFPEIPAGQTRSTDNHASSQSAGLYPEESRQSNQAKSSDNHTTSAKVTNQTYPRQQVESQQRKAGDRNELFTGFRNIRNMQTDNFGNPGPQSQGTPITEIVPSDFWGAPVYRTASGLWCPGYEGNLFADNPWDFVGIPGLYQHSSNVGLPQTPGICRVSVSKGRTVDKKKSQGTDGDTLTFSGINSAEGEIQVMIWTPDQWELFKTIWPILSPPQGKAPPGAKTARTTVGKGTTKIFVQAYDVQHPKFTVHKIKSVVFLHGSGPEDGWVNGAKVFTAKWVEYIDPIKTDVTRTIKGAEAKDSTYSTTYANSDPGRTSAGTDP